MLNQRKTSVDKIVLSGLEFHGFHGVFPEEAKLGARFIVDLELFTDFPEQDEHEKTVDYAMIYELIRNEVIDERYDLIESLAQAIALRVLKEQSRVVRVIVRVHKPHAPLPGVVRDVYVEVDRQR